VEYNTVFSDDLLNLLFSRVIDVVVIAINIYCFLVVNKECYD